MNKKIFQNLKMQDFIAGLILQQLLSILIFVFREGHEIIERGGVEKWTLGICSDVILYVICIVCVKWVREKICKENKRNIKMDQWKYIGAFLVMLFGEVSDWWAFIAVSIFLLLLITDGRYYRMGEYRLRNLCLPLVGLILLIIVWINLAQYMQIPFWKMKGIPERMKNRLFLMCNIGISYIVLLFLDTFKKYRNRQEQ